MTGIDKICEKIIAEAQAECDAVISRAEQEAAGIRASYDALAKEEAGKIIAKGEKTASEREARLAGSSGMEAKKLLLKTRQQMLDAAFSAALEKLCALPEDEYVNTLALLAAKSAISGREEVILSPRDREVFGKQIVAEANRILSEEKTSDASGVLRLGRQLLDRLVGGLTLSEETRDISGGVILRQEKMEVNATFDTLIRLSRDELSGEVNGLLFG